MQYQGFGVDALTSLAVYTFSPADTSSGTYSLGFYTGPYLGKGAGAKAAKDNTILVSNYLNASYKYAVDKSLAFVAGVETDLSVSPVVFFTSFFSSRAMRSGDAPSRTQPVTSRNASSSESGSTSGVSARKTAIT